MHLFSCKRHDFLELHPKTHHLDSERTKKKSKNKPPQPTSAPNEIIPPRMKFPFLSNFPNGPPESPVQAICERIEIGTTRKEEKEETNCRRHFLLLHKSWFCCLVYQRIEQSRDRLKRLEFGLFLKYLVLLCFECFPNQLSKLLLFFERFFEYLMFFSAFF